MSAGWVEKPRIEAVLRQLYPEEMTPMAKRIFDSVLHDDATTLCDVALRATDETMWEGTYATINAGHPHPGVQAALSRADQIEGGLL